MDERAIAATRNAFAEAIREGDPQAAASLYAERARLLAPSAELIEGRTAVEAFWRAGMGAGLSDVELQAAEVQSHDRLAYEIGRYVFRLDAGARGPVVDRGSYVLVLEKEPDGEWRRAVEMFSPELPSAPAVAPNVRIGDQYRRV